MLTKTTFVVCYLAGMAWLIGWEITALVYNYKWSISELTWSWEGTGWTAARYLTVVGLGWLTLHLAFKWFR
jgi:hypothetical protein